METVGAMTVSCQALHAGRFLVDKKVLSSRGRCPKDHGRDRNPACSAHIKWSDNDGDVGRVFFSLSQIKGEAKE